MSKAKPDLIVIGVIAGAHGVRGDVRVKSFTAEPEALFDYAPFLDEKGKTLIDPKGARPAKDHFIVMPKVTKQKEEWDGLKGAKLYVPREALPETDDDEFYIEDLVGLAAFGGGDAPIGKVKAVFNHGAGDLLEIQPTEGGKSVLVPFTLADVPVVDLSLGRIVVTSFEIWADESKPEDED
jgi:16S rRNA processing protein RimM